MKIKTGLREGGHVKLTSRERKNSSQGVAHTISSPLFPLLRSVNSVAFTRLVRK